MSFQLSPEVDKNKIFLVQLSELEGRFDCEYYIPDLIRNINLIKKMPHVKLGEKITDIKTGYNSNQYPSGDTPFLRTQNVRPIWLDITKTTFTKDEIIRISKYGDLLFTRIGVNVGDVGFNDIGDFSISDNVILVRITDHETAKFCAIFLATDLGKSFIKREKRDTARAIISYENIKRILIPKLQINIQLEIIKKMDVAYATKKCKEAEARRLLDSIDDYLLGQLGIELPEQTENTLQSRIFTRRLSEVSGGRFDPFFNNLFFSNLERSIAKSYFETKFLEKLVKPISGVTYSQKDERAHGHKILRANNIDLKTNELYLNSIRHIDESIALSVEMKLYENDILMSSASGSKEHAGKVAFVDKNIEYYFGAFMTVLRPIDSSCFASKYLFNFLTSNIYRKLIFRFLGGTNINNVGFEKIKKIKIPLPSLKKQTEIANHITEIRNQAKRLQQQAKAGLEQAKKEVEAMILGEDEG